MANFVYDKTKKTLTGHGQTWKVRSGIPGSYSPISNGLYTAPKGSLMAGSPGHGVPSDPKSQVPRVHEPMPVQNPGTQGRFAVIVRNGKFQEAFRQHRAEHLCFPGTDLPHLYPNGPIFQRRTLFFLPGSPAALDTQGTVPADIIEAALRIPADNTAKRNTITGQK